MKAIDNSEKPTVGETLINELTAAKDEMSCSPRHLANLRAAGKIPYIRVGQLIRYSPRALDRWIAEQMTDGNTEAL